MKINILLIILLSCAVISTSFYNFKDVPGIDFYQFWAVDKAQEISGHQVRNPYKEQVKYRAVLAYHAEHSSDTRLKKVSAFRKTLDLCATPLFYSLFALFPRDYSSAISIYQVIQIASFLISLIILGILYKERKSSFLILALVLLLFYRPLQSELRVVNVNTLQLAATTLLILFAEYICQANRRILAGNILLMCGLAFITLVKPNLVPVTLMLAMHVQARHGTRTFLISIISYVVSCGLLFLFTSHFFSSWTIWLDWYNFLIGSDNTKLFYPVSQGNYAPVLLLAEHLNISKSMATASFSGGLLLTVLCALVIQQARDGFSKQQFFQSVLSPLQNPNLAVAIGIIVMLTLSPLVWFHYYVLSLLPALWLIAGKQAGVFGAILGATSLLLTGNIIFPLLSQLFGWSLSIPLGVAGGLIPLWLGVIIVLSRK